MKKILLSATLLTAFCSMAQVIETSDFTAYTNGNIGTTTNGSTAGQGGFFTLGGSNADYRILNDGVQHGRVFQLTGSAGSTDDHFMWKDGLDLAWAVREDGNDILEIEFDYFTGSVTTSQNSIRLLIFNADLSKILGGYMIAQNTKIISGLAYYEDDPGNGTYQYSLGSDNNDIVLPNNSWIRLGMSFKRSDGKVIWKGPGFDSFTNGTTAGEDPAEIDFLATAIYDEGAENTVASTARFDNYIVRAVAVDGLLGADHFESSQMTISVFPNPVVDRVTIFSKGNAIDKISITDMNGRIIKEAQFDGLENIDLDVTALSKGIYMMVITTADHQTTVKKIVKK